MARSILSIALRLKSTQDALIFGKTLSEEELVELRNLIRLLRCFKNQIDDANIIMKLTFRIQFIQEAIEFAAKKVKNPFNELEKNYKGGSYERSIRI